MKKLITLSVFILLISAINSYSAGFTDDFETGALSASWASSADAIVDNGGTCPGLYAGSYICHFNGSSTPRHVTTGSYNANGGGTITFYLRIGDDEDAINCEEVDIDEGVHIQYDNGGGWTDLGYIEAGTPAYIGGYGLVSVTVPTSLGSSVTFRLAQTQHSGTNYDGWAIDNFTLSLTDIVAPTVTTNAATSRTINSATGNGNITATGGENSTTRGVCWKLFSSGGDPTTADNTNPQTGSFSTGAFSRSMSGLSAETQYKYRAYATNSAGTGYGATVDFWTLSNEPTLGISVMKFRPVGTTSLTAKWRRGNGANCIVVMKASTTFGSFPLVDGTTYNANSVFPTGDPATEGFIVYKGTGTTVNITGLTTGTTYYLMVVEFNGSGTTENYLQPSGAYIFSITTL